MKSKAETPSKPQQSDAGSNASESNAVATVVVDLATVIGTAAVAGSGMVING